MTTHTNEEFEIMRRACYLWQETAQTWEQRALKAEAKLAEIDKAIGEYQFSQIWDQHLQEIIDR